MFHREIPDKFSKIGFGLPHHGFSQASPPNPLFLPLVPSLRFQFSFTFSPSKHLLIHKYIVYIDSVFIFLFFAGQVSAVHNHTITEQKYLFHSRPTKLFVFGDSYADTGNNNRDKASSWKFPYGISFPGKPSGRYSNGRVLTDFLGI